MCFDESMDFGDELGCRRCGILLCGRCDSLLCRECVANKENAMNATGFESTLRPGDVVTIYWDIAIDKNPICTMRLIEPLSGVQTAEGFPNFQDWRGEVVTVLNKDPGLYPGKTSIYSVALPGVLVSASQADIAAALQGIIDEGGLFGSAESLAEDVFERLRGMYR